MVSCANYCETEWLIAEFSCAQEQGYYQEGGCIKYNRSVSELRRFILAHSSVSLAPTVLSLVTIPQFLSALQHLDPRAFQSLSTLGERTDGGKLNTVDYGLRIRINFASLTDMHCSYVSERLYG